ncbi:glycoside hydrolase family protein [Prosthecobacter sp.]
MKHALSLLTLLLALHAAEPVEIENPQPNGPTRDDLISGDPAGPWRRLFLDATVVEEQQGVQRVFHAVEKHPANPVMVKDKAWEGSGPYLYGTVMQDGGKLRMWYHHQTPQGCWNSYAESANGLVWTKPVLGLIEDKGSTQNNLFSTRSLNLSEKPPHDRGQCHNPSVIYQPWHPDPQRRYALYSFSYEFYVPRVAFSPDGLRWTFEPLTDNKGLFDSGDVVNFFHDPYRGQFVGTWKSGTSRGRAVGVATSPDGLVWTKSVKGAVMFADDLDPDATQIYGMPVFPYQGYYLGLPWIYHARWPKVRPATDAELPVAEKTSPCTMDVQFAWSRDLLHWNRTPARDSFIPLGGEGDFDASMVFSARAPVVVDDKLYFYYGGFTHPHKVGPPTNQGAIGLGVLRLDGFCSMQAGKEEGSLTTRDEALETPVVTINARTHAGGQVIAEIVDATGTPLAGFSRNECLPFQGDNVRHIMRWRTGAFTPQQQAVDKRLRFYLKDADLYSYLVGDPHAAKTVIFDPAKSGSLLPSDSTLPQSQRFTMRGHPSGYQLQREGSITYLDLHSAASAKTNAAFAKDASWDDAADWCLEGWYRVADKGTQPTYGLATFMSPPAGRNAALYLSDREAGILSTDGSNHKVLKSTPLDTTDRFHWYRLVHTGGASGALFLEVDGKEVIRLPYSELRIRDHTALNILFGPNASNQEGRMHVAKFGYRIGSVEPLFGPVSEPNQ